MNATGPGWQRPPQMPPWLAALVAVGAILLTINVLPSLASALTPNRASDRAPASVSFDVSSDGSSDGAAATHRSPSSAAARARCSRAKPAPAPTSSQGGSRPDGAYDRARTYGVDPSNLRESHASVRGALVGATEVCRDPLPRSGASLERAELGAFLLAGGLALLVMIGFKTDRPWPGRYVRRSH